MLEGIDAALAAGFDPVKINMVAKRGVNDHEITLSRRPSTGSSCILRFIEFMDVGNTNGWRMDDVVPASEIVSTISREFALEALPPNYAGEVARRFRHADGGGEIGIISSVTQPFCHSCTRARISAEGQLYTCLFGAHGHDLRALLRSDLDDAAVAKTISAIWTARDDRYSELRSTATTHEPKVEMSKVGG